MQRSMISVWAKLDGRLTQPQQLFCPNSSSYEELYLDKPVESGKMLQNAERHFGIYLRVRTIVQADFLCYLCRPKIMR